MLLSKAFIILYELIPKYDISNTNFQISSLVKV